MFYDPIIEERCEPTASCIHFAMFISTVIGSLSLLLPSDWLSSDKEEHCDWLAVLSYVCVRFEWPFFPVSVDHCDLPSPVSAEHCDWPFSNRAKRCDWLFLHPVSLSRIFSMLGFYPLWHSDCETGYYLTVIALNNYHSCHMLCHLTLNGLCLCLVT